MRSGCSLSAEEGDVGYFPHSRSFPPFPLAKGTGSGYNGSTFPGEHMKKTVSYSKSQLLDDLGRLALMVLASVIMAVNLKSFVQAGDLVPGGFNGLTLLIQRVALRFWGLSVPFSAINFLLNAIPAIVSFRLIGKRFTLYSCLMIVLTSVLTDVIPSMPLTDDVLLICIFGGIINGFQEVLSSVVVLAAFIPMLMDTGDQRRHRLYRRGRLRTDECGCLELCAAGQRGDAGGGRLPVRLG